MDEIAPKKRSALRFARDAVAVVVIAPAIVYFLLVMGKMPAPTPSERPAFSSVAAGSQGRLWNGGTAIPIAIDEELLPGITGAAASRDPNALSSLGGRVFFVDSGTSVQVSESGISASRVRILAGSEKGRQGWVPNDWLKP